MAKKQSASQKKLAAAMAEVHTRIPSTVKRAKVTGAKKEAMLKAIAFSKARAKGAKLPKRKKKA